LEVKTVQPSAFVGFLRKFLHDAGEKATAGPAKKPTPAEVGLTVLQGSASVEDLDENYDKAWQYDSVLVQEVFEQKHPNKDLGELSKAQLVAMQKAVYFALYGKAWEGQGKRAGQVEYEDAHAPSSAFKGAHPSKKKVTGKGVRRPIYGRGISSQISAKFYIDLKILNSTPNPRLAIKYRSTARSVMDQEVTPAVKSIVMSILSITLDAKQYAKLSAEEQDMVLLFLASANARNVSVYADAIEEMTRKLTILVGEINSGNDSEIVRNMALASAEKLFRLKAITRLEYLSLRDSM
jgi:hypothetical protein